MTEHEAAATNETLRAIMDRRSIRAYKDEPLSPIQIETLKQAALASPSARNLQSWHFSFVTNRQVIGTIEQAVVSGLEQSADSQMTERIKSRGGTIFYNAPLVVFISSDRESRWSGIDAGIAVENLALAAHSMGLGSVIVGLCAVAFENDRNLAKLAGFPEDCDFSIAIAIGSPDMTKEAHPAGQGKITDVV